VVRHDAITAIRPRGIVMPRYREHLLVLHGADVAGKDTGQFEAGRSFQGVLG
jgi:hypothetical protein